MWPSCTCLTKILSGLEGGGDPNPSAYYVAFHCFLSVFFFFFPFQLFWLKALFEDFFAVFELVASAFTESCVQAPSRAARFHLLGLISQRDVRFKHRKESSISQQRHLRYLIEAETNTLYIRVNTKGVAVYI